MALPLFLSPLTFLRARYLGENTAITSSVFRRQRPSSSLCCRRPRPFDVIFYYFFLSFAQESADDDSSHANVCVCVRM